MMPNTLKKYGYTEGCPGCAMKQAGMTGSTNHSEECRERIEAELSKEEEGREKLRKHAERINKWLAEKGQDGGQTGPTRDTRTPREDGALSPAFRDGGKEQVQRVDSDR